MTAAATVNEWLSETLQDILGVEADEVTPEATFFGDLGGESIDLLELQFRCGQHYGGQFDVAHILRHEEMTMTSDGQLDDRARAVLREKLSFLPADELERAMGVGTVQELLTVRFLDLYIGHYAEARRQGGG